MTSLRLAAAAEAWPGLGLGGRSAAESGSESGEQSSESEFSPPPPPAGPGSPDSEPEAARLNLASSHSGGLPAARPGTPARPGRGWRSRDHHDYRRAVTVDGDSHAVIDWDSWESSVCVYNAKISRCFTVHWQTPLCHGPSPPCQ